MALPLPRRALAWLTVSILVSGLYMFRVLIEEIPPQDHVALSFIVCFLLTQTALHLEQTRLRISLPHNRCWLRHHHLGKVREQSLPVTQIHSARLEYSDGQQDLESLNARIVLVTSLGMIPVSHKHTHKAWVLDRTCNHINHFLESKQKYFQA
ncbi:MAG: hypothetical protein AB8B87_09020 [Granulosicoccus sp.]